MQIPSVFRFYQKIVGFLRFVYSQFRRSYRPHTKRTQRFSSGRRLGHSDELRSNPDFRQRYVFKAKTKLWMHQRFIQAHRVVRRFVPTCEVEELPNLATLEFNRQNVSGRRLRREKENG